MSVCSTEGAHSSSSSSSDPVASRRLADPKAPPLPGGAAGGRAGRASVRYEEHGSILRHVVLKVSVSILIFVFNFHVSSNKLSYPYLRGTRSYV